MLFYFNFLNRIKVLKDEKKMWQEEQLKDRQDYMALRIKYEEKELEVDELKRLVESLGGDSCLPRRRTSLCEKLKPSLSFLKARGMKKER